MNRRQFIQKSTAGAAVLAMPAIPSFAAETKMGIVVHSYGYRWNSKVNSVNYPGFTTAIALLEHAHQLGAGGIQVVMNDWSADFARSVRDRREKLGLYLEGSVGMPKKPEDVAHFEQNVIRAKEAGANVLRTVCSGGRRYEILHTAEGFREMQKNALLSMQLAEPILQKHKVKLGVENHKDWRSDEHVAMLKQIGSEWVGATVDFGNNMSLLEDSLTVVTNLAPYAMSTHVKDMGVEEYTDGFLLSEVPLGKGVLDLPKLVSICQKHKPDVTFSLEMITRDPLQIACLTDDYWSTFQNLPGTNLAHMLHTVKQHTYPSGLPRTTPMTAEERLAFEDKNIRECLAYSREKLRMA